MGNDVTKVATPLLSVPVPRVFEPVMKLTVPVAAAGATVAVRMTLAPVVTVVAEAAICVVVEGRLTVPLTAGVELEQPMVASVSAVRIVAAMALRVADRVMFMVDSLKS